MITTSGSGTTRRKAIDANLPAAAEASGHGVRSRQPGMLARRRRIRNVRSADTRPEHTRAGSLSRPSAHFQALAHLAQQEVNPIALDDLLGLRGPDSSLLSTC